MKKNISSLFIAFATFFVIGCGGGGSTPSLDVPSESEKLELTDDNSNDVALTSVNSVLYTTELLETSGTARVINDNMDIVKKTIQVAKNYNTVDASEICQTGSATADESEYKVTITFDNCKLVDSDVLVQKGSVTYETDEDNYYYGVIIVDDLYAETANEEIKAYNARIEIDYDTTIVTVDGWVKPSCLDGWIKVETTKELIVDDNYNSVTGELKITGQDDKYITVTFEDNSVTVTDVNGEKYYYTLDEFEELLANSKC